MTVAPFESLGRFSARKAFYGLLLVCGAAITSPARAQDLVYAKGLKNQINPGGDVFSAKLKIDETGSTFVAGAFSGTADFDTGSVTHSLTSAGSADIFIAKYDAGGNLIFARSIGGPLGDYCNGLDIDDQGNIFITGYFSGTADFDPGPGTAYLKSADGLKDIFIAAYDSKGTLVFAHVLQRTLTSPYNNYDNYGTALELDPQGDLLVAGSFSRTVDFDPGAGAASLISPEFSQDIFIAKYDRAGNYMFAKALGGPQPHNGHPTSIAVDASGGFLITGGVTGTMDFDPGDQVSNVYASRLDDIFLARYDADGNYIYSKSISGFMIETGNDITVDVAGNAYLTGIFDYTMNFGGEGRGGELTSHGNVDIFIAKFDPLGKFIFAKGIGGPEPDVPTSIALDKLGRLYITGYFNGAADFNPDTGSSILTSAGLNDGFIASLDTSGNYIYAKRFGGKQADQGNWIEADSTGKLYIAGSFKDTADLDPGEGAAIFRVVGTGTNGFVLKTGSSGEFVSALQLGNLPVGNNEILWDRGRGIAVDATGNTYVTGTFLGTVDFDPGPGVADFTSSGLGHVFVAKYDSAGNYKFALAFGGPVYDYGNAIALDRQGNIYVTGAFGGTVDFDPGPGTALLTSTGQFDVFIAKYDPAGQFVFAKAVGGLSSDFSSGLVIDSSGNLLVSGYFQGAVDFDPGAGVAILNSAGGDDVFVAKYNSSGNFIYAKSLGGTASDYGRAIATDHSGNAYITGSFQQAIFFGEGAGRIQLLSSGSSDIFIAKYDSSGHAVFAIAAGGADDDHGDGIALDSIGNVFVTGSFQQSVDFDPGPGSSVLAAAGADDIFIAKYNAAGGYVYAKSIGGTMSDYARGITAERSGNVYVTGNFRDTADFDPGAGTAKRTSVGSDDIFIAKYDPAGNYVYVRSMGGKNFDYGLGIAADALGNAYVIGSFQDTADFDPGNGTGNSKLIASNSEDIFIAKFGPFTALPVQLLSFTAMPLRNAQSVQISWRTASEVNNAYFEIERSGGGHLFETIARLPGCNTCNVPQQYNFYDNAPLPGVSYYRLKQVDKDGSVLLSQVIAVKLIPVSSSSIMIYPSTTSGSVHVVIRGEPVNSRVRIRLVDSGGRLVGQETVVLQAGIHAFQYSLANHPRGVYYLSISDGKGKLLTTGQVIRR